MSWYSKHSDMDESKSEILAHSDSGSVSVKASSVMEEKHDRFYFPDGNITFLVGFTLYRVHRFFFNRDSEIFRGMFDLKPPTAGQDEEGSSNRNSIELKGQDKNDFECFLPYFTPRIIWNNIVPPIGSAVFASQSNGDSNPKSGWLRIHLRNNTVPPTPSLRAASATSPRSISSRTLRN